MKAKKLKVHIHVHIYIYSFYLISILVEPIHQNQKCISNFIEDKEKSIRSLAQNFDSHAIKLEKLQSTLPSDISGQSTNF